MMGSAIALGIYFFLRQSGSAYEEETKAFQGQRRSLLDNYRRALHSVDALLKTWVDMNAKKLPKGLVYRSLPNNFVSIEDKSVFWYITKRNHKAITPVHAVAVYQGVKEFDVALAPALNRLNVSCVHLRPTIQDLKHFTHGKLKNIHSSSGEICGLSSLKLDRNLTILNDEKRFIVVSVPYASRDLRVKFKAMTVTNEKGPVFKNIPMDLDVGRALVQGTISLNVIPLKYMGPPTFAQMQLKAVAFEGVEVKIDGINEPSPAMDLVETTNLVDFIIDKVRRRVNSVLAKMATPLSKEMRRGRVIPTWREKYSRRKLGSKKSSKG